MTDPTLITIDAPGGALLLSAKQSAKLCGVSVATFWRWDSAGRIPMALRIGGTTRWRLDDLKNWAAAGCPHREDQT